MTIKELYEYCESMGAEDCPVMVDYTCHDDWYCWRDIITPEMIEIHATDVVYINVENI